MFIYIVNQPPTRSVFIYTHRYMLVTRFCQLLTIQASEITPSSENMPLLLTQLLTLQDLLLHINMHVYCDDNIQKICVLLNRKTV